MDDERLYRQYVNGNRDAADMLVDRYADALTLYINGFIGDIHEAEDLMIESFALIFAKARRSAEKEASEVICTESPGISHSGIERSEESDLSVWKTFLLN